MTKQNYSTLHARHAELLKMEEEADQRFDALEEERFAMIRAGVPADEAFPAGYREAEAERDSLFEERKQLERKLLRLRSCSPEEVYANLSIAIKDAEIFDAGVDLLHLVRRQFEALLKRPVRPDRPQVC